MTFEHFRLKRKFPQLKCFIVPTFILLMHFSFTHYYYGAFFLLKQDPLRSGKDNQVCGVKDLSICKSFLNISAKCLMAAAAHLITFNPILATLGVISFGGNSINIIIWLFLSYYSLSTTSLTSQTIIGMIPRSSYGFYYSAFGLNLLYKALYQLNPLKLINKISHRCIGNYINYDFNYRSIRFPPKTTPDITKLVTG